MKSLATFFPPATATRIVAMDGLRGVASLAVLALHYAVVVPELKPAIPYLLKAAGLGVALFFSLSAFLLYLPIARGRSLHAKTFIKRRAWRILPAYYAAFFLAIAVAYFRDRIPSSPAIFAHLVFVHNWVKAWHMPEFGSAWTMCMVVYFYAALPFLVLWVRRSGLRILVLTSVVFIIPLLIPIQSIPSFILILSLPFAFGMLAAWHVASGRSGRYFTWIGISCMGMFILFARQMPLEDSLWFQILNMRGLVVCVCCYFLLIGLATEKTAFSRCLSWPFLRFCGVCSYGIYLYHCAAKEFLLAWNHPWQCMLIGIPLSLLMAFLSYAYFENPLVRWAAKSDKPPQARPQDLGAQIHSVLSDEPGQEKSMVCAE